MVLGVTGLKSNIKRNRQSFSLVYLSRRRLAGQKLCFQYYKRLAVKKQVGFLKIGLFILLPLWYDSFICLYFMCILPKCRVDDEAGR